MRVVLQRVTEASVTIDGQLFNEIQQGYLLLVGIVDGDDRDVYKRQARALLIRFNIDVIASPATTPLDFGFGFSLT